MRGVLGSFAPHPLGSPRRPSAPKQPPRGLHNNHCATYRESLESGKHVIWEVSPSDALYDISHQMRVYSFADPHIVRQLLRPGQERRTFGIRLRNPRTLGIRREELHHNFAGHTQGRPANTNNARAPLQPH